MKNMFAMIVGCFISIHALAVVDLNTATQAKLESVSGIGPAKAKAILDYRGKNGGFKTVDDLDKVPGFGKATLDRIRGELAVGAVRVPAAKPDPVKPLKK